MKRKYKILILLSVLLLTISFTAIPAFALTESEVQNQVNAVGKEAVTGIPIYRFAQSSLLKKRPSLLCGFYVPLPF